MVLSLCVLPVLRAVRLPHLSLSLFAVSQASTGLRDRLAALSRRYSSTTLEQAAVEAAEAEEQGAAEAGPAEVVEAAAEEAEASLLAAAAVASPQSAVASPQSAGTTQTGGETPSGLGSAGSALGHSPPAALWAGGGLPLSPSWPTGQPLDMAGRVDAILADLQQRLGVLESSAAGGAAAGLQAAEGAAPAAVRAPAAATADAATQTAAGPVRLAAHAAVTSSLLAGSGGAEETAVGTWHRITQASRDDGHVSAVAI